MKNIKYMLLALPFYLAAAFSLFAYIYIGLHPGIVLNPLGRLTILAFFCACTYFGGRLLCKVSFVNSEKTMKGIFLIFFVLYISLLLTFTLFDPMFGRSGTIRFIFSDNTACKHYFENSFNIIPFATIFEYTAAFFERSMSLSAVATNLAGNLVALMPMAIFLPLFVKKCRKLLPFLLCTAVAVVVIELSQLLFMTGACDIDDLILNVLGAGAAYLVLKMKPINKMLNKLMVVDR